MSTPKTSSKHSYINTWIKHSSAIFITGTLLFVCLFAAIVVYRAWVCDDSYITFRVVQNFHSGFGFRWNIAERVQVFTHPLWMLLITFFYAFTHELYLTSLFLSIFLSMGAVILLILREKKNLGLWIGILLLSLSSAYVDYSTSGLENPLSHFLIALFLFTYFKDGNETNERRIFWLSLITGFACLNRFDHILIYLPVLVYLIFRSNSRRVSALIVFFGFLPLLVWLMFSTIYYGNPLPNTFYAKVGDWLPRDVIMGQGLKYCLHTLKNDPITGLTIIVNLVLAGIKPEPERMPLALGGLSYILYVIWIGGDFMEGRFFTTIFIGSVFQLIHYDFLKSSWNRIACIIPLIVVISLFSSIPTLAFSDEGFTESWEDGIVNERVFYADTTGLFRDGVFHAYHEHPWKWEGERLKEDCEEKWKCHVALNNIGFSGVAAGPDVYIVDRYGLGSAFMARISPEVTEDWRIGHFYRKIPIGYMTYLRTGDLTHVEDLDTQKLIKKVEIITEFPVFSDDRLMMIFDLLTE